VAITALLLFIWGAPEPAGGHETQPGRSPAAQGEVADPVESLEQAAGTIRELLTTVYALLPKLALGLLLIGLAALAARVTRVIMRRALGRWERTEALATLAALGFYLTAIAVASSVLAGDARALLGSVGLIGLALSWALQTPIESFTGWLLNSMRIYYRVGDRIEVGGVFGDVYKIDVLTTTVWEAGGPGKAVAGAQPTGAMITFPNWEVLRSNIVNYSREFPYVWDEVAIAVTNESDLSYTIRVFEEVSRDVVGGGMIGATERYQSLLARARVAFEVDDEPRVFVSTADAWTNCTVRYLVEARQRRRRASDLVVALSAAAADRAHAGRIRLAYPRTEVRLQDSWSSGDSPSAEYRSDRRVSDRSGDD
jgi:small-conductance mechanosensitive channel